MNGNGKSSALVPRIIKLTQEDIIRKWEFILPAITAALPPTYLADPSATGHRIQAALMDGRLECWVLAGEAGEAVAIATTMNLTEEVGGGREMLVYSLYGEGDMRADYMTQWLEAAGEIARGRGMSRISFYTDSQSLVGVVGRSMPGRVVARHYVVVDVSQDAAQIPVKE